MRIGYYAHHHGSGHCRQADKLAALLPPELRQQMTVFTSLADDDYRFTGLKDEQIVRLHAEDELPDDVLGGRAGAYWQPNSLHYSPVGNSDIQTRSWQLLDEIRQRQIDLMIIDVSVEVAMLCRVASVPYLYVRLAGERDDIAHLNAFAGALGLVVPYPKALEAAATLHWVRQKSLYLDFLADKHNPSLTLADFIKKVATLTDDSAIHQRLNPYLSQATAVKNEHHNQRRYPPPLAIVTVIKGYGGHEAIDARLPKLRDVLPEALIISLGPISDEGRQWVDIAAHVDDVTPFIMHSELLLMAGGLNGIAQAYPYATPLVILPDTRPHREQEVMAEALIAQGRALSWAQFIAQMSNEKDADKFMHPLSVAQDFTTDTSSPAAQNFMDSLIYYESANAWFQDWLLPQLKVNVEI